MVSPGLPTIEPKAEVVPVMPEMEMFRTCAASGAFVALQVKVLPPRSDADQGCAGFHLDVADVDVLVILWRVRAQFEPQERYAAAG